MFLDCFAGNDNIVEGKNLIANNLTGFVALARDNENIASLQKPNTVGNRFRPVSDLDCSGRILQNFAANGRRVFGSRIVIRYNCLVSQTNRGGAHHWPLTSVTVTATPDRDDKTTICMRAQGGEDTFQGIRGMSVVNVNAAA
jgi:hypothetical protein